MSSTVSSDSSCGLGSRAWLPPLLWGLTAGLTAGAASVLFALTKLPLPLRAAIALVPVMPALAYVRCIVRIFRWVDELQRRIQLEALAFAFPATAILVMAVDLLTQAGVVPPLHLGWGGLITAMCLLWLGGWVRAGRRYR